MNPFAAVHVLNGVSVLSAYRRGAFVLIGWLCGWAVLAQPATKLWSFSTGGAIRSSPALGADGTVYVGSTDGKVYAVTPGGIERWEFATLAAVGGSVALGAGDTVYVGSFDFNLYALSSQGQLRWLFRTGNAIESTPAIGADGTVIVGSNDGKLYAFAPDGSNQWQFDAKAPIFASPAIGADGTIYFGARDGRFYALASNGVLKWNFLTAGPIFASAAIGPDGTTNSSIYFGSQDGRLYAFHPDGSLRWTFANSVGIYSSPAVGPDGAVYYAGNDFQVYALWPNGTPRWTNSTDLRVSYSSVAVGADGSVLVGSADGKLYSFSSGATNRWTFATTAPINYSSPALAAGGTIYIGSDDGKLYALKGATGPAGSAWPMFRRDAFHTADGFVERRLPATYSPGEQLVVALLATPPPGVTTYTVEDTPPANWTLGDISDSGSYDAANRRVKFGPFFDARPRRLTYEVTPPMNDSGRRQFAGNSSANGADRLVGGDQVLNLAPAHPADNNPVDNWLTVGEITSYAAAWKRGLSWPVPPNPVPNSYVLRAIALWQAGESYVYTTNASSAPQWWITPPAGLAAAPNPPLPPLGSVATNGLAISTLPLHSSPGTTLTVTLDLHPASNVVVFAVEDQPPPGWAVSQISDRGSFDQARGKVKWGPFFDNLPRGLSYQVTSGTNIGVFSGIVAFDGSVGQIMGQRRTIPSGLAVSLVERLLPPTYSPGERFVVTLQAMLETNATTYVIEDRPPDGWKVGNISDAGYFDSTSGTVRYGPFFDAQPRTVTYEITPPIGETGLGVFAGVLTVDDLTSSIEGAFSLDFIPVHPADAKPTDNWITLPEMTAYCAAWKRGSNWSLPPNPIPVDYLQQTISLWRGGEFYQFDPTITNAPLWWVNTTNLPAAAIVPIAIPPGANATNGNATVALPKLYQPGVPLTVTVTATPASSVLVYALEDRPPAGWQVAQITGGGFYDSARGKVKWGPFFDAVSRTVSYQVTPPPNASGQVVFSGGAGFDAQSDAFSGRRQAFVADATSSPRFTAPTWSAAGGLQLSFAGFANEVYLLQASSDLIRWQTLVTLTNSTGVLSFSDPPSTNFNYRFYRVIWP